ncbi:MAG: tetratricopeptide repeat protein [Candidatus Aminicenantes bacterium]|nr:tetratricopeptide repeat protein [Candidatus Aminicenantes bacterium]
MPRRERIAVAALPALLLIMGPGLSAAKSTIKGKVLDRANHPVADAAVTIISVEYPAQRMKLKSDKKGAFVQIGLDPGDYRVLCEKEGFHAREEFVRVAINEIVEKNFVLDSAVEPVQVEEIAGRKELREAHALYQQGKYEEALAAYRAAAVRAPEDPVVRYNIGVACMALEKTEEAIAAFLKTLEFQPESVPALKNLGQIYGRLKLYEESAKYNARAAEYSARDPEVFYNLGVSLMNLGSQDEALAALRKSIACDENYADSYYQLGLILVNQNKMTEALDVFEEFLRLAPDDGRAPNVKELIKMIKKGPSS